ncbi:MAG TPA: response regulator [Bryobacteraceae bacterium]|nr:response regulator [Bryobacteraceae bacterium]
MTPIVVLLVEDEAGDALLTSQVLAEAPFPVKLHIARDGAQALQMLSDETFRPDVIILDLNLPQMNGFRMLQRFERSEIPVVVFSVSNRETDKVLAKGLGAVEYIVKPTDLDQFREALWGMVERWGGQQNGAKRVTTR